MDFFPCVSCYYEFIQLCKTQVWCNILCKNCIHDKCSLFVCVIIFSLELLFM